MTELSYRKANEADLPTIIEFLADDRLGSSRESADPEAMIRYRAAFAEIASDPNQFLCVVEDGEEVVGTFQLSFISGLSRGGANVRRSNLSASQADGEARRSGKPCLPGPWTTAAGKGVP